MSFAEAFTKGFITSYQQSSSDAAQNMRLRAKDDAERIRKKQEELDKATKKDQEYLDSGRVLAQSFGLGDNEEAVLAFAEQRKAGNTFASIQQAWIRGDISFNGSPSGASTQNAVLDPGDEDQQTMDAFDAAPDDAEIIPFGGTSQTVSQASGDTGAAPAVKFSPSTPSNAPAASGGSTGNRPSGIQFNQRSAKPTKLGTQTALINLRAAEASGDPAAIQRAKDELEIVREAIRMETGAKDSVDVRQFVQFNPDGTYAATKDGFMEMTSSGPVFKDFDGNIITNARPERPKEPEDRLKVITVVNTERASYNTAVSDFTNALTLADEAKAIVEMDENVLTKTAGLVQDIFAVAREFGAASSIVGQLFDANKGSKSTENNPVTREEFEDALARSNVLPQGMSTEDLERLDLTSVSNLAQRRALFDAKIYLLAFRSGALEGQSGQAMSDKDYERLMKIIYASKDAKVFNQQLNDYLRGGARNLNRRARLLNSGEVGGLAAFESMYGYPPVDSVVPTVESYLKDDPEALSAYERLMSTTSVRQQQQQRAATPPTAPQATPAATQPAAQPAQSDVVTISSDEDYARLPSGTIFIAPDGVKRRKP